MTRLMAIVLILITFRGAAQQVGTTVAAGNPSAYFSLPLKKMKVDQLYLLGRIWGFLKYHHPAIAKGKYDWDKELIGLMPAYLGTKNEQQGSDTLLAWINKLGDVPVWDSVRGKDVSNAALLPDTGWIYKAGMSKALSNKITAIRANRALGDQQYVRFMAEDDIHVAVFEHENSYAMMTYPPVEYRLLALFRYWNMIEYWYPYKYGLMVKWEKVLKAFIPRVVAATNVGEYVAVMQALIATIHDSHAVVQSRVITETLGNYVMPCWIKFIEGRAVVIGILNDSLAQRANIQRGDIIESINEVPVARLVKDKRPFISASNEASYLNLLRYTLVRSQQETNEWVINRGGQLEKRKVQYALSKTAMKVKPGTFTYERDSSISVLGNGIGYINLGNFQRKDSAALRRLVSSVKGLIIDNRQYPKGLTAGDIIGNSILQEAAPFVKFSSADPAMPGRFLYSKPTNMGATGSSDPIPPKIAILVNEETQSSTEFQAMMFRRSPGAILMGTPTAGADGNVALIVLPGNIYTYISGLGVYYPDGNETQRVGLLPDVLVKPTIRGLQENRDEVLEAAVGWIKSDQKSLPVQP